MPPRTEVWNIWNRLTLISKLLALDSNYGFSRAVNEGIRHADTPYVILLNNDTTVDSRYVEEMIRAIEVSDRIFL